eukprot:211549-Hanusia_phi.AAC.2
MRSWTFTSARCTTRRCFSTPTGERARGSNGTSDWRGRGAVDAASSKVKHYRQKIKSGKSRQEAKVQEEETGAGRADVPADGVVHPRVHPS